MARYDDAAHAGGPYPPAVHVPKTTVRTTTGMKPETFADLNKPSKDLLTKEFTTDVKVEIETRATNGVVFNSFVKKTSKGDVFGEIKLKAKDVSNGLTVEGVVNTANAASGKVTFEDQLAKGLKLTAESSPTPDLSKLGLTYKHDHFTFGTEVKTTSSLSAFDITGDFTIGYEGFVLGAAANYNTEKNDVNRVDTALAYVQPDMNVYFSTRDKGDTLAVAYYQKVKPGFSVGGDFAYSRANTSNAFNLVGRYDLIGPDNAFCKAKVSDSGLVSLAYGQDLRPGMKGVVSGILDTKGLNNGALHKVGLSLIIKD